MFPFSLEAPAPTGWSWDKILKVAGLILSGVWFLLTWAFRLGQMREDMKDFRQKVLAQGAANAEQIRRVRRGLHHTRKAVKDLQAERPAAAGQETPA